MRRKSRFEGYLQHFENKSQRYRVQPKEFLQALQTEAATLTKTVAASNGDWIVKGFIDIYFNVYTLSVDTKVVSKVLELLLYPVFVRFAET